MDVDVGKTEEIPLEEREVSEEDEFHDAETSFGELSDLWEDLRDDDPVPIVLSDLDFKPGGGVDHILKEVKRVKRIFLLKLFDKQLDPSYGEKTSSLFNRLSVKYQRDGGGTPIAYLFNFDLDVVGAWVEGEGYIKNTDSPRFQEFEELVRDTVAEHDATPLGRFERQLEEQFGIEHLKPSVLREEFDRKLKRGEIIYDKESGEVTFDMRVDDCSRLLRFKQFAKRNLFLFSGLAITIAAALTAVILVVR